MTIHAAHVISAIEIEAHCYHDEFVQKSSRARISKHIALQLVKAARQPEAQQIPMSHCVPY